MKRSSLPLFALFLLLSCQRNEQQPPHRQEQNSMKKQHPQFNGTKAFSYLIAQTNFGPRNPNSAGHQRCLEFLTKEFQKYSDNVTLQSFSVQGYSETLTLSNIFASFQPTLSKRILLIAHWDTRPRAEKDPDPEKRNKPIIGANDGASGVAVLLELARLFKESPPPIGVDILLTDGEDYGDSRKDENNNLYLLGAKHFAKTKSPSYNPHFGILLDMVGDKDLQIPLEQHSIRYAPHVLDLVWKTAEEIGITNFINVPGELITDDHIPLNEAGIPTIDIIDFQYPYWHTHQDTPDKCSAESLEAVGKVLAALIYTRLEK
jgi:glutaminyl-peptide cyclotransferase